MKESLQEKDRIKVHNATRHLDNVVEIFLRSETPVIVTFVNFQRTEPPVTV